MTSWTATCGTEAAGTKLVPNNIAETTAQCVPPSRNVYGGALVTFLFFGSIIFSVWQSLWLAIYPNSVCPNKPM